MKNKQSRSDQFVQQVFNDQQIYDDKIRLLFIKPYSTSAETSVQSDHSFCPAPQKAGSKSFIEIDMLNVDQAPSPDFVSEETSAKESNTIAFIITIRTSSVRKLKVYRRSCHMPNWQSTLKGKK
jgi:hypothetical protein